MSNLSMTQAEEKSIDSKIEQMMDWAKTRQIEAEQLALDSARLMACTTDRLDRLSRQGFYRRCWSRFNGEAGAMERANVNDVIQMQKMAFRYVNMLQEQQLLMAHSLLSLKNNLNSLAVKEEETRNLIAMLAQRTLERFEQLESRVGKLETSSNLHDWLFTLEERDYEEKIPTDYMRLLRVINDFYEIKNDNWNNNDLMFMRKAIPTVGLNPKQKLSINAFIDKLADEIQSSEVGFDAYEKALTMFAPDGMDNYSQFALENVSSPVFASLHGLNTHYKDKMDAVEALQDSLSISASDALKTLLRKSIKSMNVNLDYEFPLAETAIEVLGCIRLTEKLNLSPDIQQDDSNIYLHMNSVQPEHHAAPQKTLLESTDLVKFAIDLATKLAHGMLEIDREVSCIRIDDKIIGSLAQDASKIINSIGIKIPIYKLIAWIDSGNVGVFITGHLDQGEGIGIFNRKRNIYGFMDFATLENCLSSLLGDDVEQALESLMPLIQSKIEAAFPEEANKINVY